MLHKEMLVATVEPEIVPGMVRAKLKIGECPNNGIMNVGFVRLGSTGETGGELTPSEGYDFLSCYPFKGGVVYTHASRPFRYDGVDYPGGEGIEDPTRLLDRWNKMVGQTVTVYLTPA